MRLFGSVLAWFLRAARTSRSDLVLENLALRQQLATYARSQKRPRIKPEERAFWVALSRVWRDWRSPLAFVKPATVIDWLCSAKTLSIGRSGPSQAGPAQPSASRPNARAGNERHVRRARDRIAAATKTAASAGR